MATHSSSGFRLKIFSTCTSIRNLNRRLSSLVSFLAPVLLAIVATTARAETANEATDRPTDPSTQIAPSAEATPVGQASTAHGEPSKRHKTLNGKAQVPADSAQSLRPTGSTAPADTAPGRVPPSQPAKSSPPTARPADAPKSDGSTDAPAEAPAEPEPAATTKATSQASGDDHQAPADGAGEAGQIKSSSSRFENKKFQETSGITDPKLRAEQGSLRRYSGKFNFGYAGPIIGDISNPYQPNPDGSVTHNPTSLRGTMGFRYRLSPVSALNFGTGISQIRPFGDTSRTDLSTPFVSYDKSYRAQAWQLRNSFNAQVVTIPEYRNVGEYAGASFAGSAYRNINYSRWLVGIDAIFSTLLYNRGYRAGPSPTPPDPGATVTAAHPHRTHGAGALPPVTLGDGNASQFNLNFNPQVKYRFSDKIGSYTGLSIEYYEPRSALGKLQLRDKTVSQRFGVEYSFTRYIYFSPFIGFYPQALSMNSTTINFTTVFSVF